MVLASVLLMGFILFAVEPIVIGVFEPMTGPYAAGGQLTMEGINLAAEQVTEVLGRPIELVLVDNKSEKVEASNAKSQIDPIQQSIGNNRQLWKCCSHTWQ